MDGQAMRLRRQSPLYALYSANAISFIGNNLTTIAIPWFVLVTTGSAAKTGITAFFSILPIVIAGIFGGTIVDRLGYKRTSIIADLASGTTVAAIALLHHLDLLSFPVLLALVFLGALLDAPGGTARAAMVPELAEPARVPLERATSLMQIVERGSRLVGAPLGGVLIAAFGPAGALWIDAATFAVSAGMVLFLVPAPPQPATGEPAAGYLHELKAGFAFIRADRLLSAVVMTVMVTNLLDAAIGSVSLPVLAKDQFDSSIALGLMAAASGGGAALGAAVYAIYGNRLSRRAVFIPAFVIVGIRPLVLAALPSLPIVIAIQVITGLAAGPLNPILGVIEFERIPAGMRGRVFGAITAGAWLAMPVGVLGGGYLIDLLGLPATFAILGVCYVVTTLTLVINPAIHDMDRRPEPVDLASNEADTPVPA
jgi:MFS family permease